MMSPKYAPNLLHSTRIAMLVLAMILATSALFSQKISDWTDAAVKAVEQNDWYTAKAYYYEAFQMDSTDLLITARYAESLRITRDYGKAEYYYDKVFSRDKGRNITDAQFWLAMMQKANGNYSEALRNFKKYYKKNKRDAAAYATLKSEQEINSCDWVLQQKRDDSAIEIQQLPEPHNTDRSEFSPFLKDSVLYYAALGNSDDQSASMWFTRFDSIPHDKNELLSEEGVFQQANLSFSADGQFVLCSMCDAQKHCDIYIGEVRDGQWNGFEKLPTINYAGARNTMPYLAQIDGKYVLFFSSDRPGGQGGMDIWWSEWSDGEPGPPANAGPMINTPDDEVSPFYIDNQLYFSSQWHAGFGGFDIFRSEGKHRDFGEPENLGYPLNTNANELYYMYDKQQLRGFMASNRLGSYVMEGETCCNDIYSFQFADSLLSEAARFENLTELNKYLPVVLYFHNDEPNPNSRDTTTSLSYVDAYNSYKKLENKYVRENQKGLAGDKIEKAQGEVEDWYTYFVDKGMSDLELFTGLLLEELERGTAVDLTIRGFASPRAESDYNVNLTKRRTSSLVNYLERYDNGIFLPYMNDTISSGGKLTFVEIPYGEGEAAAGVNDDLNNEQASIYSRAARLERKIMIESVQRTQEKLEPLSLSETEHDFGTISHLYPVEHRFDITNTTGDTIHIDSLSVSCGCTVPQLSRFDIPPGENAEMVVEYNPEGTFGQVIRGILIWTSEATEPRRILIKADVR